MESKAWIKEVIQHFDNLLSTIRIYIAKWPIQYGPYYMDPYHMVHIIWSILYGPCADLIQDYNTLSNKNRLSLKVNDARIFKAIIEFISSCVNDIQLNACDMHVIKLNLNLGT